MRSRRTLGLCDRCGQQFKLTALKAQVVARKTTNLLVCRHCLDEDHPQWFPAKVRIGDPAPVRDVRIDPDEEAIFSGFGWGPVGGKGSFIICGIFYDFDMEDTVNENGACFDYLGLESGEILTMGGDETIETEASCL